MPELIVPRPRARVVGAGLSGLAAAWCLSDLGYAVEVIDAAERTGGVIETVTTPEGLVERAANAFRWNDVAERWFRTLGIEPVFPLPTSRRRYIFRNGRGRRWPLTATETFSMGLRAGLHYVRGTWGAGQRESASGWSDRVLGRQATSWLISPALQGVYGVTGDRLSARAIRPNRPRRRRGARLAAPRNGMGEIITALTAGLNARGARFRLGFALRDLDPACPTVVCTDVASAAALIAPHAPALGAALGAVESQPVTSVTAFFDPSEEDVHGFGMLFPRPAGVRALGMLINSDIFAGRSSARSETWIYADRPSCPDAAFEWLMNDRRRVTGKDVTPRRVELSPRVASLPVYGCAVLGIAPILASTPPWLTLTGNYTGDIGVTGLLAGAEAAVSRLARWAIRRQQSA